MLTTSGLPSLGCGCRIVVPGPAPVHRAAIGFKKPTRAPMGSFDVLVADEAEEQKALAPRAEPHTLPPRQINDDHGLPGSMWIQAQVNADGSLSVNVTRALQETLAKVPRLPRDLFEALQRAKHGIR